MKRLSEVMNETDVDSSKGNTLTISSINDQGSRECPLCGGLGYVRENVPVGHPNFGKLFPCRCKLAEIEQQRREQLRALSNLDHLARMTFESFVPEGYGLLPDKAANLSLAFDLARQYANKPQGWLVLFGGYGCGKTHLAAAIANHVIERGLSVLFVVVPDLLDHLRATYSPSSAVGYDERFTEVRNAPLLILDDLGTQSSTPWAQEKLFQIFNYRYNAQLPTVVTSNHSLDEIDPRIRSRLEDRALSKFLRIEAPDYRQRDVDQSQSVLSSLELMKDMTFESFSLRENELPPEERANLKHAFDTCRQYAAFPQGWLVLTGVYGCGKTHLAAAIANACVATGEPALFVVVPDLLDHLRATFNPSSQVRFDKRFEEVRTAPLLVLDDLGTESASPWAQEKLYQLFNYRYNARLPTVITMAQQIDDVDPRLRTRMLDRERCTLYGIIVPGFRGSARRQASSDKKPRNPRPRK
jgi:DNA replication protein DnaC